MARATKPPAQTIDIRCPHCGSDQPFFVMIDLESLAIEDGKIVRRVTGHRLACQNRGCVFSIGPHGVFTHHAQAIPLAPLGPMPSPPDGPPGTQTPLGDEPNEVLPTPRRRSRV